MGRERESLNSGGGIGVASNHIEEHSDEEDHENNSQKVVASYDDWFN